MAQAGQGAAGAKITPTAEQENPAAPAVDERVKELEAEIARLKAENTLLLEQVTTTTGQAVPGRVSEPSFTFSEGQRHELETTGRTVSPFTGKTYVGTPDNAREASAEEFAKAKPVKPAADRTDRKR